MRRFNLFFLLFLISLLSTSVVKAQIKNKICDTIRYEFVHDKIIIPVSVNGVQAKYILDTGGRTGTMYDAALEMKATSAGFMKVSDMNSQSASYEEAHLKDLHIGKRFHVQQIKSLVLPINPFFKELGVVGILGGEVFAQSVITFDSRSKIIVLNYPYRPEKLKVTDGTPLLDKGEQRANILVKAGDTDIEVLFDTGADGFLLYSRKDYLQIGSKMKAKVINTGYGIVAAGLTGLGNPVDIEKITIPQLYIHNKEFLNLGSVTTAMNGTIIGVDLLKYGKVVIDYMRKRFYFLPFESTATDLGGAHPTWNVSILPRNERFEITTVWNSMKEKVSVGDEVININGSSLEQCPMSQSAVEEMMNNIPGDTGYIIVRKEGIDTKIEIKKE